MSYLLVNAAMVPNAGTFNYRLISADDARSWLDEHSAVAVSYIGYQQTADHLRALYEGGCTDYQQGGSREGEWIPRLSRAKCTMQPGDEALVCRLAYRVADPSTKGQPQEDDWEYGILRCQVGPEDPHPWGDPPVCYHCHTCANAMGEQCHAPSHGGGLRGGDLA